MKLVLLSAGLFILMNMCQLINGQKSRLTKKDFDDSGLTTVEIIEKYGYPVETHQTVTEDGYILELHRIPHGRNYTEPGFPILMAHSLFFDSSIFVISGKKSLGFFLADEGFDIWLINFRGNHYTKAHKRLSSKDSKFWDFSLHELGVYDLPALVDYICNNTNNEDLLYLGFSMGTTNFFIMASERPEYQSKIRGAALLAPVASLKHSNAPVRFGYIPLSKLITLLSKPHLFLTDFQDSRVIQELLRFACDLTKVNRRICKYAIFATSGFDAEGFDERTVPNLSTHFSSTSTKVVEHYGQLFLTRKFQQYDYGKAKNLAIYNRPSPPEYHLESITIPISIFVSREDLFSNPENVYEAIKGIRSVKSVYVVPQTGFTHLEFAVGKYAAEILYPEVVKQLRGFISNGNVETEENNTFTSTP